MPTSVIAEPIANITTQITPVVTEAIKQVAQQAVPEPTQAPMFAMKFNPWFDWPTILNLPAHIWITAVFFIFFISVNLYWLFRMKKLQSVRGYVDALKKATQEDVMVWIISTTKNLTIECLRKRDTVLSFYDKVNITKWTHTSPFSVLHIGGKGGVIVSEDYPRSRDIISEIALSYACDEHNKNNPKQPINNYDDYEDYGRQLLQIGHPEGLPIPSYSIFDPNKWRKYFPAGETATLQGGIIVRDARKLKVMSRVPGPWEKILRMGMFIAIGLVVVIAAWMVPLGSG